MIDVTLDGKPRRLSLTVGALSELELRAKHLGWFLEELRQGRCGFAVSRWLLWAGLQHEGAPPTLSEVDAILERHISTGGKLHEFTGPFVRLLAELFPERDQGNATPEGGLPSPTSGSPSG